MFANFFKSKKTDEEVIASLIVLTHKVRATINKSFIEYLQTINSSHKYSDVKRIGLFSLSLFLVTSQFLMLSKRRNKVSLLDYYTNSMIDDCIKNFHEMDENFTVEKKNRFVLMYQDYYSKLGDRFLSFLEDSKLTNEFSVYCASEIFQANDLITQIYLNKVIALNIVEIRSHIKNQLN